jgi:biotin carboxylase
MKESLARAGCATGRFARCRSDSDIVNFFDASRKRSIVVKAPAGGATHNVFRCHSVEEAKSAHFRVVSTADLWGQLSDYSVAEEYLVGKEYEVNVFANGSEVHVVDIWESEKRDIGSQRMLYFTERLVPRSAAEWNTLSEYAKKAAAAVGICIGPGHLEIILTEAGPRLIEVGSRLAGGRMPDIVSAYSNFDVYKSTVTAFINGRVEIPNPVEMPGKFAIVSCPSVDRPPTKDTLVKAASLFSKLPSFVDLEISDTHEATSDLTNVPLTVWLRSSDEENLEADIQRIHSTFEYLMANESK